MLWEQDVLGRSLYTHHSFTVNLKLFRKSKVLIKKGKHLIIKNIPPKLHPPLSKLT